jgi:hypothetical protein
MCWYSKELDTVTHLLWCFLYSFLVLLLWSHFFQYDYPTVVGLPFWSPHVSRPKVAQISPPHCMQQKFCIMMDLKGGWRVATLQSDGCLPIGRVGTWNIIHCSSDPSMPPLISPPAISLWFFLLTRSFSFLILVPYNELSRQVGGDIGVK